MTAKPKIRKLVKQYLQYFLVWTFAMTLFTVIRRVGTVDAHANEVMKQMTLAATIEFTLPLIFMLSFLTLITQNVMGARRTMRMRFSKLIALAMFFDTTIVVIVFLMAYKGVNAMGFRDLAPSEDIFRLMFRKNVLVAGLYITIINALIHITRQINTALGKGNLLKMLKGTYHEPKEESRIFMFLDLQSSTTAAEKMGHFKYSQMIQECYYDLTLPIQKNDGQIYQYVGDEAVIIWKPSKGLSEAKCIQLFFDFDKILAKKREVFLQKYDWHPQFKAGVHMGMTIATQVGYVKREIAYHGDTLNTAARILSLCNTKGAKVLISEFLKEQIESTTDDRNWDFANRGAEILKGKKESVELYEVKQLDNVLT